MKILLQSFGRLAPWQKLVVIVLLLIVVLTWLGVCLVLGSYVV
jgi:hypothetical protein